MLTGAIWDRQDREDARRHASRMYDTDVEKELDGTVRLTANGDCDCQWISSDIWFNSRDVL